MLSQKQIMQNVKITCVYIYSSQQQIIVVSEDRTITILNAFNLEKIQIVKDVGTLHSVRYTASAFDTTEGRLWCTCQRMTEWEFGIDDEVEIKALQTSTLMKHML